MSGETSALAARSDTKQGATPIRRHRIGMFAAIVFCLFLIPIELGWLPYFRYAWGFNLWQYLPPAVSFSLAGALLLLCWRWPRGLLLHYVRQCFDEMRQRRALPVVWLAFASLPVVLWLIRERVFLGDSKILLVSMATRQTLTYFPEFGATFLLKLAFDLGHFSGLGAINGLQALVCLTALPTLLCFARVAGYLTPTRGWAAFATVLPLIGGVTRIFAGHVEAYAIVLLAMGGYLWAALAFLKARCDYTLPCLALGVGIWVHLGFAFLIPSLLVLSVLAAPSLTPRACLGQWAVGLVTAAIPTGAFIAILWVAGHGGDLQQAWFKLVSWSELGGARNEYGTVWIGFWGEVESGTSYVLLSRSHLKYLINSFFILSPAAVPVVLAFAISAPRNFGSKPQTVFLTTATLSLIVYACAVRPVFGPYEWDLFTVTAVSLAFLAAHLLANTPADESLSHLCTLLVGATVLAVTVPWLVVGIYAHETAGPFAIDALRASKDGRFYETLVRELAPWL